MLRGEQVAGVEASADPRRGGELAEVVGVGAGGVARGFLEGGRGAGVAAAREDVLLELLEADDYCGGGGRAGDEVLEVG